MEKNRYELLKKVKLEKSGIIKCHINDPVYKFCILNDIDNLGDFVKLYEEQGYKMDSGHNFYYFDGIVDLINLVFLNDELPEAKLLCHKIKIFKNEKFCTHYAYVERSPIFQGSRSENAALRRLGFNNKETKSILEHVLYIDREVSIIAAIKFCLENIDFKNLTDDDKMFVSKLYILNCYYKKNKTTIEKEDSYEFYKAQEDIIKLKELYRKFFNIQKRIIEFSSDFEQNVEKLPKNDERVKRLIKSYEDFNCKED